MYGEATRTASQVSATSNLKYEEMKIVCGQQQHSELEYLHYKTMRKFRNCDKREHFNVGVEGWAKLREL